MRVSQASMEPVCQGPDYRQENRLIDFCDRTYEAVIDWADTGLWEKVGECLEDLKGNFVRELKLLREYPMWEFVESWLGDWEGARSHSPD